MTDPVKDTMKLAEEVFGDIMGKEWRASVAVQARIIMAKSNIARIQRCKRMCANGLDSIRMNLKWYQIYQRLNYHLNNYFFRTSLSVRVDKLTADWERVIKFPNNMILSMAKEEQAKFEKDFKVTLSHMARLPNTDSMEG